MLLEKIIASEDVESLQFYQDDDLLNNEICAHIKKTKDFSAENIYKNLSKKHLNRYLELATFENTKNIKASITSHNTKITNNEMSEIITVKNWNEILDKIQLKL